MGHHVFISYSRKNREYARKLAKDLRANGIEPWNDEDIEHGARWWPTIVEAIQDCTAFVVVMTTESDVSEWVLKEIMLADRDEKLILPLLLSGKGHAYLIGRQHEDVTDGQMPPEAFYDQLRRLLSNRTEDELRSDVLHFTIHYDPEKIKRGQSSTIKLKFINRSRP